MGKRLAKKVLLIGWDAADWKVINPLMDSGQMPALERLVNGGVMGNIATLDPPLSPMLWTSIATGKRPYKHGVLGFTEPNENADGIRPVLVTSRKVKAIWNILTQHQLKTHVLGWWPSHPAEPINGIAISNFFQRSNKSMDEKWEMADGAVFPEAKADFFSKFRVHPQELTAAHIIPFVADAAKVDQEKDKRLFTISNILAHCTSLHAAATYILEHEEWDFMGLYLDAIDHFCHAFMKFHPPKMDKVSQEDFELYKDVVNSAYRFHDMMLERLVELAGPEATIILISDHGFHPDHLRPEKFPKEPAALALEHSPFGIICMNGPGIRNDERIYGSSLLDITPTLLTLFGLPVAEDMDGKVLVNAFNEPVQIDLVPSWESISGYDGMHPKGIKEDPTMAAEAIDQLVQLGYIEKPSENKDEAVKSAVNENMYYLARSYIDAGLFKEAIPILEELFKEHKWFRYGMRLAFSYLNLDRITDCRQTIEVLKTMSEKIPPGIYMIEGALLLKENKPTKALEIIHKAESETPNIPKVNYQLGQAYLMLKQWEDAERAFRKELEINPENSRANHGLGITFLRRSRFDEAINAFLNAVGLIYQFPMAHFHLGEAFLLSEQYQKAAEAFEVSIRMNPNLNKARVYLIQIYEDHLKNPESAALHRENLPDHIEGEIFIVSGLPRSGTSMMMQMLKEGGLPIFTDDQRKPDESNPKGYYEHEAVKRLMSDQRWLYDAKNKAVKVISHLLFHLPARFHYKIVFMERDLNEVLGSQHKMLHREGKLKSDTVSYKLIKNYQQNLEKVKQWVPQQANIECLFVKYADVIENPGQESRRIKNFLQVELNIEAMEAIVDKSLYREKSIS